MASRNLTAQFLDLRDKSRVSLSMPRSIAHPPDHGSIRLLADSPQEVDTEMTAMGKIPPVWVDFVDTIKHDLNRIVLEMGNLKRLHNERLKVTFSGGSESKQDEEIDYLSSQITTLLKRCENNIKQIAIKGNDGKSLSEEEKIVRLNVMRGMANKIRNESKNFRVMQKEFLNRLQKRDASGDEYFANEKINGIEIQDIVEGKLTLEQMNYINEMKDIANSREKEIIKIAQSINELASMFKELSVLIVEQGSVLDRIDYNIEQAQVKVAGGLKEVKIADDYSKSSAKRSFFCIAILLVAIAIVSGLLVAKYKN